MTRPIPGSRDGTSRRAALGLGLVAAVTALSAAGCTEDDPPTDLRPRGGERAGSLGTSPPSPDDEADPDAALVASVVAEISRAHARVRAERRAHPPLSGRLRGLERLHATHAAELGGLTRVAPGSVAAEQRRDRVVPRLATAELRLQERLVGDSVAAESGALALLLAAMAAGVAQERVLL